MQRSFKVAAASVACGGLIAGLLAIASGPAVAGTGNTWQSGPTGPAARVSPAVTYDADHSASVLFGGSGGSGTRLDDTWTLAGGTWTQAAPVTSPAARSDAAIGYDAARHQVVLFGGSGQSGRLGDTWTWDGTSWTQLPVTGPSPRFGAAMAWDPVSQRLIMFGGDVPGGQSGDTWAWDGSAWTLASTTGPAAREDAAAAAVPGGILLFGGTTTAGDQGDTWLWNGSAWAQQSPATSPPARDSAVMVGDTARGSAVLYGGTGGAGKLADTWEWKAGAWVVRSFTSIPAGRTGAGAAYQTASDNILVMGGRTASAPTAETWLLDANVGTPAAPSGVVAAPGNGAATVSWTPPAVTGGAPLTGYLVTASPGGHTVTVGNVTTASVTGLTNYTAYTFTVQALNPAVGAASSPSPSVMPGMAGTVDNVPTAVDAVSGSSTPRVRATAQIGNTLYIGGTFTTTGGQPRANLAAVSLTPGSTYGKVTTFRADTNGPVLALAANATGTGLYVGGSFTTIGGQARKYVAYVATSGAVGATFVATPDNSVEAIAAAASYVYIGGKFKTVAGKSLPNLAQLNAGTGAPTTTWRPAPAGTPPTIHTLVLTSSSAGSLYVGGQFTSIAGVAQANLAAISTSTGTLVSTWRPSITGHSIWWLQADVAANRLYVASNYKGGEVAAYQLTGYGRYWAVATDGDVQTLTLVGSTLYIGGHFEKAGGQTAYHIGALNPATGAVLPWSQSQTVNMGGWSGALAVWTMRSAGGSLWIGGDFDQINFKPVSHLSSYRVII